MSGDRMSHASLLDRLCPNCSFEHCEVSFWDDGGVPHKTTRCFACGASTHSVEPSMEPTSRAQSNPAFWHTYPDRQHWTEEEREEAEMGVYGLNRSAARG